MLKIVSSGRGKKVIRTEKKPEKKPEEKPVEKTSVDKKKELKK